MKNMSRKIALLSGGILIFALALSLASGCGRSAAREAEPNNSAGQANRLSAGQTMEGFLDSTDDLDWYRLDVRRPAIFDITLSALRGINHAMKIWRDDNGLRLVKYIDDARKSSPERFCNLYARPGTYFISVQHGTGDEKQASREDPYHLKVTQREMTFLEEIEPNDTPSSATQMRIDTEISGYYSPAYNRMNEDKGNLYREEDWYYLDLEAGPDPTVFVDVEFSGVTEVNGALSLYNDRMQEVGTFDAKGAGEGEAARGIGLPAPGRYYILVASNARHSNGDTPYRLAVQRRAYDEAGEIEPNNDFTKANRIARSEVRGFLYPSGDTDFYHIEPGRGPELYTIEALPPESLNIAVAIYDREKHKLLVIDNGGKGEAEILPGLYVDGTRYIEVFSRAGDSDEKAAYRLQVSSRPFVNGYEIEPNDDKSSATKVLSNTVIGYSSKPNDLDYYLMEYGKKQRKQFNVRSPRGSELRVSITDHHGYILRSETVRDDGEREFSETIDGKAYLIIESLRANYREPYSIEIGNE